MRLTVQGWQNLILSVMGVVVFTGAIAGAVLVGRTDTLSDELIAEIQPARVAAYQLQAALRDQETAVRGYAIAADPQFLAPYDEGQRVESESAAGIREFLDGRADLLADLDAIEKAAAAWRATYADPMIFSIQPGRPRIGDDMAAARGKAQFDQLRALFDVQNSHLSDARTAGIEDLDWMRNWRNGVLIAMIVAFFAMAVVLAILVRNAVNRPLAALAAACRRITQGNFAERIAPKGPKDIRAIAIDVENMRQRIVDELDASRSAREALDEQAEELRRSNAELEQFAYVASHDLQEPLRKVASFCQLLERRYGDKLDERGAEYIGFAVDGAKRMQVLINDLLTFSRVGRLNSTTTEVDLNAVMDAALNNISTAMEESGAEIVRPDEPLPHVDGDPTLLIMVWQNLLGNAVKFRREGVTPRIVVEYRPQTVGDIDNWLFTVSDNGIGISEEFVDKVFVIFQRLHGRDAYSGTGIGLALCKKIIEHHGGNIWIDTSYTGGTRFCFTLPVTPTTVPDVLVDAELEGNPR
ncbi:sensor histidine kinase [Mycolicibacterium goodii]|uniref:sensor histidine kinase n=1 Tax=Mycolicibacterium goodii TaxID=134601 RepID=UPI001BDBB2EC|nr:CHASE3 domain-containing protein [Mycolicibacterium goodii]MBU8812926.1 CHASE3 domain-containing protein [Mycolicibacterium goodii]MBU8827882.1 CHASE3 domain-containing protein [Mycolicibacterium goodii]